MNYIIITSLIAFFEHIVGRGRNAGFYELELVVYTWDAAWGTNETLELFIRRYQDEVRETQVLFTNSWNVVEGDNGLLSTMNAIEHPGMDEIDAVLTKCQEMFPDVKLTRRDRHIPHWDLFTNAKCHIRKEEAPALYEQHLDHMMELDLYEPSPYEQDDCDFMAEKEADDAEWREVDRADHPEQYEDPDALPF